MDAVCWVDRCGAVRCLDDQDRNSFAQAVGAALGVGWHAGAGEFAAAQGDCFGWLRDPDECPSWAIDRHQAFRAELTDGLPHRRAADAVLLGQPQLAGQRLAGSEAARRDLVAQQIGELAENRAVGRRIDHDFYGTWS